MKFVTITITSVILLGCGPNLDIWEAADEGNITEIKRQLDFGEDVNSKNQFGATPLHFAAKQGHKNLAALLITEGADTNAEAYDKSTPLHSAVISGYKEVAEQLIANGADVNAKGYEGSTPLDNAIEFKHSDTADLLRKHGGKTGEELKAAEQVSKAEATDISIHNAVIEGDIQAINQSLEASMDINAKDEKGWAPMHLVAIDGNKVIAELLLKSGANVNERTDFGWTPLHLADNKKIAQLLITKGANLNAKNDGGETPLDWAIKRKDIATTDLLRKHGAKTGKELKAEVK